MPTTDDPRPKPLLPKLYAIVDAAALGNDAARILHFVEELLAGGATLIQLRFKQGSSQEILARAREIKRVVEARRGEAPFRRRLILNDRADLALAAGWDGVHLGQEDLPVEAARAVLGNLLWVGVSTHNEEQVRAAEMTSADYIAVGPVFATGTKLNSDPVIGLDGVRRARSLTRRPLVAIGGITRSNCRQVIAAGADSVAVIAGLLREPRSATADFLRLML